MTEAAPAPAANGEEPSIEEILASIRKIISDEPGAEGEAPAAADAEPEPAAAAVPDMPPPPAATAPPLKAEAAPAANDVLDLSEFAEAPNPAASESFAAPNHPKVERDQAAEGENLGFDLGLEDSSNEGRMTDDANIEEVMAAVNFAAANGGAPAGDPLVSDNSANVATAAMAKLAQASEPAPGETQLWVGARTIEQVVEDLMRPMLKTWLDQNLPRLVERLVEKELARMARRATE